jgi:hypothetical protein
MIQFKRGKSLTWHNQKTPLADGQPGYDKDRRKIKIGDGEKSWKDLPYASGLFADEILDSEKEAKIKVKKRASLNPLANLASKVFNLEDRTIITYGTEAPNDDIVGQIYLQHYDTEPEVDYIIESGINGIWYYRKWHSGRADASGVLTLTTSIQNALEGATLYYDSRAMSQVNYPITFKQTPSEIATVQSPGGLVWLASRTANTTTKSSAYSLISTDSHNSATYQVSLRAEGFWK